jgi:hypothetical protein
MDPYTFALALGVLGLLVMGASGLGHRLDPGGHIRAHGRARRREQYARSSGYIIHG